jgi:hypothetical protein
LYPNVFNQNGEKGGYFARTANDSTLGVTEICTSMRDRGGFSGNLQEAIDHVRQFHDEMIWLLCDGFAVNTGYFSIYPKIGGTFKSPKETHDPEKNPISFKYRSLNPLLKLIGHIAVEVGPVADTNGSITSFTDVTAGAVNETVSGGDQFVIEGDRIRVAGDDPSCGVYFESPELEQRIKVKENFAENSPSKIIGVVPMLIVPRSYRVVIVTQFSSGSYYLKEPRTVASKFTLSAP